MQIVLLVLINSANSADSANETGPKANFRTHFSSKLIIFSCKIMISRLFILIFRAASAKKMIFNLANLQNTFQKLWLYFQLKYKRLKFRLKLDLTIPKWSPGPQEFNFHHQNSQNTKNLTHNSTKNTKII